jgi:hypothetical protein
MWKWSWIAACLLVCGASGNAAEPTPCPLLKDPPVIDGWLDDDAWKGVPFTGGLVNLADARSKRCGVAYVAMTWGKICHDA